MTIFKKYFIYMFDFYLMIFYSNKIAWMISEFEYSSFSDLRYRLVAFFSELHTGMC